MCLYINRIIKALWPELVSAWLWFSGKGLFYQRCCWYKPSICTLSKVRIVRSHNLHNYRHIGMTCSVQMQGEVFHGGGNSKWPRDAIPRQNSWVNIGYAVYSLCSIAGYILEPRIWVEVCFFFPGNWLSYQSAWIDKLLAAVAPPMYTIVYLGNAIVSWKSSS